MMVRRGLLNRSLVTDDHLEVEEMFAQSGVAQQREATVGWLTNGATGCGRAIVFAIE